MPGQNQTVKPMGNFPEGNYKILSGSQAEHKDTDGNEMMENEADKTEAVLRRRSTQH